MRRKILVPVLSAALLFGNASSKVQAITREQASRKNFLEEILSEPFESEEFIGLTYQNPEWELFTLSFGSYALTNMAFSDSTLRKSGAEHVDLAIQHAMDSRVYSSYGFQGFPF